MLLRQCNLATVKTFCGQLAQKRYGCSNGDEQNFTVVRNVLRNNCRSRNLIGHYLFWVTSPRISTLFTRPFLAGRRVRAGHETRRIPKNSPSQTKLTNQYSVASFPGPTQLGGAWERGCIVSLCCVYSVM